MTDAKRAAHLAAASAPLMPVLAKGDRPTMVRIDALKRDVIFHLTPFAKGCDLASASDPKRSYQVWNRMPGQALDGLFKRLEVSPLNAEISPVNAQETAIHPAGCPHAPWAFVWSGLAFHEVAEALAKLQALRAAA